MARSLTVTFKGARQQEYLLDMSDVIVGRGRSAHIRLDGNPIVSRQHLVVREHGASGTHVVEDLGGANGTFVSGERVTVHTLRPGDRIQLGEHTLRYGFSTREATSVRADVRSATGSAGDDDRTTQELGVLEEISFENVQEVDSHDRIGALARGTPQPPPPPTPGNASDWADSAPAHTRAASREDLEEMLREMTIKAKPHLEWHHGDRPDLLPLNSPPVQMGYVDGFGVRLPGSRFLGLGKLAATLVIDAGAWCVVPESPFWSPVKLKGGKLTKMRRLSDGDELDVRGQKLVYRKGGS